MDVFDVVRKVFHIKTPVDKKERKGPFITCIPYPNYTIATGFAGAAPFNISFYTSKKYRDRLSFFNNMFQYTQYKQIIYFTLSNLFFHHDKWQFNGDWRYYNFPTYTYGLGTSSLPSELDKVDYQHLRIYEVAYREVANNLSVGLGYHLDYRWGIRDFNAENGERTDYQQYGFSKTSTSSGLSANLLFDSRNNQNNPLYGTYLNFQFRTNLKALGGNSNWNSIIIDARKYIPLTHKWKTELAFWGYVWLTINGKPPYLDMPGTGWDTYNNTGRGYALGRFRGLNMLYLETEFRFAITRNGLLGGVTFLNLQTFSEWPNTTFGMFQPGGGVGLRIKLNKRTNTNSAFDYGFGTGGSNGFAFNLNEVF